MVPHSRKAMFVYMRIYAQVVFIHIYIEFFIPFHLSTMQLDLGIDKATGLAAMVQFARTTNDQGFERYLQKVRGTTFKQFVNSSEPLSNASNYGFAPLDCVRERIPWTTMRKKYSVRDLVQWGMNFEIAAKIGLKPSHLGGDKGFEILQEMGATEEQIKSFLFNYEAIKSSKFSPATLKNAGFSFQELVKHGCNASNMKQLEGFDIKTIVLSFKPTAEEWLMADFTDKGIKNRKWDESLYRRFIASQTCKVLPKSEQAEKAPSIDMTKARAVQPPSIKSLGEAIDTKKLLNFQLNINDRRL